MPSNAFIGEKRDLAGGTHADAGSLLVVLQNGKPVRVVSPGGRIWRGFRAPVIGSLYVVPVNRGTVEVEQIVRDVATRADGYVIASIPLRLRVRLDPSNDYEQLKGFLRDRGETFAEDLMLELRNGIEALVSQALSRRTHDELYGTPIVHILKPGSEPVRIAGGLLSIETMTINGRVEWSPVFLSVRKSRDDETIGLAINRTDHTLAIDRVRVDSAIDTAKYAEYSVLAGHLGVPVEYFVNPEALAANRATALEILTKMLEPANRSLLQRDPALLSNLLSATGVSQLAKPLSAPHELPLDAPQSARVIDAPVVRSTASDWTTPAADSLDLNIDRRIARPLTRDVPDLPDLIGAAAANKEGVATVLIVTESSQVQVPTSFITSMARILGVQHAGVIPIIATNYNELVAGLLLHAFGGEAQQVAVDCSVEPRDGAEILKVIVRGDPRLTQSVIARLTDVRRTELSALENLMPFAHVAVQIG